jgi:DNA-binding NarL/FixJ family response regulator
MPMPLKVFLVEDSAVIRENLIATLEELAQVEVIGFAPDEPAAIAWCAVMPQRADLVIVDLFLAQGSGLGVLRGLQSQPLAPHCVVVTNYATPEIRARCAALGAERVFDKSHEIDALIAHCRSLAASG